MKRPADLVIMDWGIGGLSVYNEIRRLLPELSVIYFSDSGRTPYGEMSALELQSRVREIILGFGNQKISHFIVACNAASTALPILTLELAGQGLKVSGVIEHGVGLIQSSRYQNIGVIGGRRTILSRQYTNPFKKHSRRVVGRIAQPLSALIERGEMSSPRMHRTLSQILRPLHDCDALVLACTHYPAIAPLIQQMLPGCKLLDPAQATARYVKVNWRLPHSVKQKSVFMTSGRPHEMIRSAKLAFDTHISSVIEV